ncbi:hypothetical protein F9874_04270 [Glaesserella parasuis]|uniref:restriction endonuclease subunit S n=1 Tax=Glaesserella parasuis TaxID=738 RepID=UPI0013249435|nr:restriction endonuclease subunit S [Glaesserella parasuis]MWQ00210.1 hypothetical protein [Glaesserella parasuis]MWQ44820.1 hypothetical protein [Glaesserella parasuis]MWQ61442.1 hypothetical protein [Glaesserella parasuis]
MKIKDIVKIKGGKRLPKGENLQTIPNQHPYIRVRDMKGKFISLDDLEYVPDNVFPQIRNYVVNENDVIISIVGTIGLVSIIDKKLDNASQTENCAKLSGLDYIDAQYLYYYLASDFGQEEIRKATVGAVQPKLPLYGIENIEIDWKTRNERISIVSILESLDKKIQLNTQINQTLEQIAQTIFKSWFIDFDPVHAKANALASGQTAEQATQAAMAVISGKNTQELHRLQTANPEQYQQLWEIADAFPSGVDEEGVPWGWEERELSYLFEFLSGAQPPKSEHIYEEKEGYERFIQNRDYSNDNHKTYIPISKKNKRCTEKDILMDKYGEAGKVRYGIKGAYNVALAKIVPQKDNLREFLRSYFTQDKIRNYLSSSSMASTRNSLNSTTFTRMKVIVPNDFLLSTFDKLANEKIDKILQIKQENIELSKLRDYLLPKLLSGEV